MLRGNPSFILKRYNASCHGAFSRPRHAGNLYTLIFVSFVDAVQNSSGLWPFLSFV